MRFLPERDKKIVQREYHLRLLSVAFILLGISAIIAAVLLLPSYFLTFSKEGILKGQTRELDSVSGIKEYEVLSGTLVETQEQLKLFSKEQVDRVKLSSILADMVLYRTDGVTVSSISFERLPGNLPRLSVSGHADRRDDLLSFKQALEHLDSFDSVELPVSNLAKDRDISFSITIVGNF